MNDFDKLAALRASAVAEHEALGPDHRALTVSTCGSISLLTFPEDAGGPLP